MMFPVLWSETYFQSPWQRYRQGTACSRSTAETWCFSPLSHPFLLAFPTWICRLFHDCLSTAYNPKNLGRHNQRLSYICGLASECLWSCELTVASLSQITQDGSLWIDLIPIPGFAFHPSSVILPAHHFTLWTTDIVGSLHICWATQYLKVGFDRRRIYTI